MSRVCYSQLGMLCVTKVHRQTHTHTYMLAHSVYAAHSPVLAPQFNNTEVKLCCNLILQWRLSCRIIHPVQYDAAISRCYQGDKLPDLCKDGAKITVWLDYVGESTVGVPFISCNSEKRKST